MHARLDLKLKRDGGFDTAFGLLNHRHKEIFMSIWFGIGLVCGLATVAIILAILKKANKGKCEYDERQVAARGRAYKGGFTTFAMAELVVFIAEMFMEKPLVIGAPGVLSILIILISCFVFVEIAIFSDAYFSPNKPFPKAWFIIMILLGISMIIRFFLENDAWYRIINLAAGIFVLTVMASIILKLLISKKSEKAEGDDQDEE